MILDVVPAADDEDDGVGGRRVALRARARGRVGARGARVEPAQLGARLAARAAAAARAQRRLNRSAHWQLLHRQNHFILY